MALEVEGKLHKVFDEEQKTDTFKTREFVIETSGEYPQFVKFQLTQDRCSLIDRFKEGDAVKVSFDLRGREWQGKYFTNLNAWRIDGDTENVEPSFNQEQVSSDDAPFDADSDVDDLPF